MVECFAGKPASHAEAAPLIGFKIGAYLQHIIGKVADVVNERG